MAEQNIRIIDDRSSGDLRATSGNAWRLVTDDVMGGISRGQLTIDTIEQHPCLHMQGEVKLDNNGGFVQIALDLSDSVLKNITDYQGITLDVFGNDEAYNIHLRSDDLWLPWQSYRITFNATPKWQTLRIPFSEFKPYRTNTSLDISELTRIGLVAIGREFNADLCVASVGLYR
ncbi:MAG TPA: CIA30 family protein [Gammaproteobacteria bacterium]